MLRLRAGLLAVCIAFLTTVGVVGTAALAVADATREQLLANYPDARSINDVPMDYRQAYRALIAEAEIAQAQGLVAPSPTPLMKLGGPEVKIPGPAGPYVGNMCKSGYGCLLASALGVGSAALGLFGATETPVDVAAPSLDPEGFYDLAKHPLQTYPSLSLQYAPCAVYTITELTVEGMLFDIPEMRVPGSQCPGYAKLTYAKDCRNNETGELVHTAGSLEYIAPGVYRIPFCVNNAPGAPPHTIQRVHFDQDTINYTGWGAPTGFYWGQNLPISEGLIRSETRCQRPDNSEYSVYSTPLPFSAGSTNVMPCNAGDTPLWVQTDHILSDGTTVVPQSVQNLQRNPPADWAPDCAVAGCRWIVKVGNVPCLIGQAGCTDWTEHKEDAECFFGPYPMPLEQCYMLERAYETQPPEVQRIPATKRNMDGDPDTWEGPTRQLTPTTAPSPTATPSPSSSVQPSTDPTTRPSPSVSSSTGTEPPPGSSGAPNPSDTAGSRCFPSGWSVFNPVQWVLMPIRCALEPDPVKTRTRVDALRSQLSTAGPGPIIASVSAVVGQAGASGGCKGPNMPFEIAGISQDIYLFDACSEPMSTVAMYVKALATVVIVIGGGLAVTRAVASGFGFSFSMGKGSTDGD